MRLLGGALRIPGQSVMDTILNVNKPTGITSFGVVALVRRLSGEHRVGHTGTLDPAASGVLPICLGQATRLAGLLVDSTKEYRAEIELGVTSDTYDLEGAVTALRDASEISREQVEAALDLFRGPILQTPPMYSASKHSGRPLYELARAGITVERQPRRVEVHCLALTDWTPPVVTIEVVCSKGTYIRSLAHDLGQALGCGGVLRNLVRLRCGPFALEDAVPLSELEEAFHAGSWQRFAYPMDWVLQDWKKVTVGEETARAIRNGQAVQLPDEEGGDRAIPSDVPGDNRRRVYTPEGALLSLMRFSACARLWRPLKVFRGP